MFQIQLEVGAALQKAQDESPNIDIPIYTLTAPPLDEESDLTVNLTDNKVKVATGNMSFADWDAYVDGITSSETYQIILQELKERYRASM